MGQVTWETQGHGTNDYIVMPETSRNIAKQFRYRSNFGKLSKKMTNKTVNQGAYSIEMDVGNSACIWSKEISSGDEVRFTLEQNISGAPTYGDAPVQMGDYIAYLHQNIILNKLDSPAIPMQGEMSQHRVKAVLADQEGAIRNEINMWLYEQYVYDVLEGFFRGASRNLMADRSIGGRGLNLGLGAGVQISPENFLVKGDGFVSGVSGTAAYETALETALGTLGSGDEITRSYISTLREAVTDKKIAPATLEDGRDRWYVGTDPQILKRLADPSGSLASDWKTAAPRSEKNPVFAPKAVEIDDFIFYEEQRLKQFRPVLLGPGVVWGTNSEDRRAFTTSSNMALMMIWGAGAMLEGHDGQVNFTMDEGKHGKGGSIAAHVLQAFMRARWTPKDGRTGIVHNQSSMVVAVYEPGPTY